MTLRLFLVFLTALHKLFEVGTGSMHTPWQAVPNVTIINGKFEIGKQLGSGLSGVVRAGKDILEDSKSVAIKIQKRGQGNLGVPPLKSEHRTHSNLLSKVLDGIPALLHFEESALYSYMVEILDKIHALGCVHNDIKPQNISVGKSSDKATRQLYLIDYGNAKCLGSNDNGARYRIDDLSLICAHLWPYMSGMSKEDKAVALEILNNYSTIVHQLTSKDKQSYIPLLDTFATKLDELDKDWRTNLDFDWITKSKNFVQFRSEDGKTVLGTFRNARIFGNTHLSNRLQIRVNAANSDNVHTSVVEFKKVLPEGSKFQLWIYSGFVDKLQDLPPSDDTFEWDRVESAELAEDDAESMSFRFNQIQQPTPVKFIIKSATDQELLKIGNAHLWEKSDVLLKLEIKKENLSNAAAEMNLANLTSYIRDASSEGYAFFIDRDNGTQRIRIQPSNPLDTEKVIIFDFVCIP